MKSSLLLAGFSFIHLIAFSQFTLKGSLTSTGGKKNINLYRITSTTREAVFVASIGIMPMTQFVYVIKHVKDGHLYKLTYPSEGDVQEFPERAFIFPVEQKKELEFSAESINELYNARVLAGSASAKLISTGILNPLSFYFQTVAKIKPECSENEKEDLFKKVIEFQQEYISSIQSSIIHSNEPGVVVAGLYFLARIQSASGEGNFRSYYNTVSSMLPATELTENFKQISKQTTLNIDIKKILSLSLKSANGMETKNFSEILTTKYTLIEFWASWCAPCRNAVKNEFPGLINKYKKDTAFSFIAVSVDADSNKWQKAHKENNITWGSYRINTTHKVPFPDFLNGNGVPYYLLLTKNGDILFSSSSLTAMRDRMKLYY